jgi:hypothetical protein
VSKKRRKRTESIAVLHIPGEELGASAVKGTDTSSDEKEDPHPYFLINVDVVVVVSFVPLDAEGKHRSSTRHLSRGLFEIGSEECWATSSNHGRQLYAWVNIPQKDGSPQPGAAAVAV